MTTELTHEQAREELRKMCIRAIDIASPFGWPWKVDAKPDGHEGYALMVWTDTTVAELPEEGESEAVTQYVVIAADSNLADALDEGEHARFDTWEDASRWRYEGDRIVRIEATLTDVTNDGKPTAGEMTDESGNDDDEDPEVDPLGFPLAGEYGERLVDEALRGATPVVPDYGAPLMEGQRA